MQKPGEIEEIVWTPERVDLLRAAAARWAGTPHFHRIAIPGQGVDCVHLVKSLLVECGIIPDSRLPWYDDRLGRMRARNVIEEILLEFLHCEVAAGEPAEGDILVTKVGRETNHVGMVIGGKFFHVPGRGRAGSDPLPVWMPRAQSLVRISGVGYKAEPSTLTWAAIRSRL